MITENRQGMTTQMLQICGAVGKGQNPNQYDINMATDCLNLAISDLRNEGFDMFQIEKVGTTLVVSDEVILSGVTYRCILSHTADATNQPGIGNSWKMYWTIDSMNTSTNTWITGTAYHSSGDIKFGVDTQEIVRMTIKISDNEWPITITGYDQYWDLELPTQTGQPVECYIDYQANPVGHFFYQPDQAYFLEYLRVKKVHSLDIANQTPDYADNWYNALTYRGAWHLSRKIRLPLVEVREIKNDAAELIMKARANTFREELNSMSAGSYRNR